MATISVTRALAQIKSLNDRIGRGCKEAFVSHLVGGKHPQGIEKTAVETQLKANVQSVEDLIKERSKLKNAVVISNATTKVKIAGVEMTVAEAIERKGSIQLEEQFLNSMRQQLVATQNIVDRQNQVANTKIDAAIQQIAGKDRKADETELKVVRESIEAKDGAVLLDSADIRGKIESLQKSIDEFKLEVDFALSEVNAKTEISV